MDVFQASNSIISIELTIKYVEQMQDVLEITIENISINKLNG
jgi:hypothetical protein